MSDSEAFDPDDVLKQAMTLHQNGDFDGAAALYRQLLKRFPAHTDLLNILGTLELQRGNANKAVLTLGRSLGINPDQAIALRHRALALQQLGRIKEALESYDKAIVLEPDNADILQNRGQLLLAVGRATDALETFETAVRRWPNRADGHYNRATVLLHLGRNADAVDGFSEALRLAPDEINAYINRGTALTRLGRFEDALLDYDAALAIKPDSAEAYANRAEALRGLGRAEDALADYDAALCLAPDDSEIHYNRGCALIEIRRRAEALDAFNAAIVRNPRYGAAYNNRGNVLIEMDRPAEALASLDRAIALDPKNAEAFTNRGNVLRALNRPREALSSYDRAIAANPDYAEAYANKAIALLHLGDYAEGWKLYEWRWKCTHSRKMFLNFSESTVRIFQETLWLGQVPPGGRPLLIHAEQGLGDTIQFCRYLPMVRAGEVIVEAPAALLPLLKTLKGRYTFCETDTQTPRFDLHCPLMSLPLVFSTTLDTVPAEVPYLSVDPEKKAQWQARLGPKTGSRIGLAWSGNAAHTDDSRRSIALDKLAPLLELPFEFHAVQKDLRPEDAEALSRLPNLRHHGEALVDFSDTAALIDEMDLVISVDTSVAHLAGALAKPLWLMLSFVSEWRWLIDRTDTPWYPTAELFRQRTRGDWDEVVGRIAARLKAELGG